jgi:hypothetical protein
MNSRWIKIERKEVNRAGIAGVCTDETERRKTCLRKQKMFDYAGLTNGKKESE